MDHTEKNPYLDFSEDLEIVEGFNTPGSYQPWVQTLSEEIQKALKRKNPTSSIKHLLAFGITAQAYQVRHTQGFLRWINAWLGVIAALLAILVYLSVTS